MLRTTRVMCLFMKTEENRMSEYVISEIYPGDKYALSQIDKLLDREGIKRDANLDYISAMYDEDYNIIGTGSCFGNTLRCFAVSHDHQGEGLLNSIITHLIDVQFRRGNMHLFLYTKINSALFFRDLGFFEIARVDDTLVFMENRRDGFASYIKKLQADKPAGNAGVNAAGAGAVDPGSPGAASRAGAIVMNANPFTLGHRYLVETAAASCDELHLFIVSEDASLVPFSVRKKLIREGTAHMQGIVLHDSGPYMISNATFPSYFLKDEKAVITGHAKLDIQIFTKIASALGINVRYVGEEPTSEVTGIYNQIMAEDLPKAGIACEIIPRKAVGGKVISASTVRTCLQTSDWETLRKLVPETTLRYFMSPEAEPVLKKIRAAGNVVHY